jgi:hypothetical protein
VNEIPGIIPEPPKVAVTKPVYNRTFPYNGRFYHANIAGGKCLTWHNEDGFLTSIQTPKKVMKKALREWRKLNPPRDRFALPNITRCTYHMTVLLRDWLNSKIQGASK